MAGASFESIFKSFGSLGSKAKNKNYANKELESGPAADYKKLTPEQQSEWRRTGKPPEHLEKEYANSSKVDDGTPVHPAENKANSEKPDPTQKDVKDVGNHAKPQIKEDTVSFSRKNSSTSNLSGKTAVEQPIGRALQAKQSMEKLYKRTTEKLSFKKKEAPKSEYQKAKDTNANWAEGNLTGIQKTHYNQLSQTQQNAWRSSGRPPENLEKYYKQMTHTNFPDRELLSGHSRAMTKEYGVNAGRSKESMQREADGVDAKANAAARQFGTNKAVAHDTPTMANQPWRNSYNEKDGLFNPPAYTEKAEKDIPTSPSTSAAGNKPVIRSKFREDLEDAPPVANIRRTSSSTLGGNSIKETSPNDLVRERPWSQASNTTFGSRPSSIHEKELAGNRQSKQDEIPPTYEKAVADKQAETAPSPLYEKSALKDNLTQRFNNWHSKWTGRADTDAYNNARIAKIQAQNSKGKDVEAYRNTTADSQNLTSAQHSRFAQTGADRKMQADIGSKHDADRWGTNYGGGQTGVNVGSGRFDDHGYNAGDF